LAKDILFLEIAEWLQEDNTFLNFGRDHKGQAVRSIFVFLKKENKGCRFHPSHKSQYKDHFQF